MNDNPRIRVASVTPGPQGETWRDDKITLVLQNDEGVNASFDLDILAVSMLALTIHPCIATLKARAGDDMNHPFGGV